MPLEVGIRSIFLSRKKAFCLTVSLFLLPSNGLVLRKGSRDYLFRSGEAMHKEFFGLTEEPFGLTPDPRFFFLTENHREIIDALIFGIGERDGLALLTGETGLGKTALIQQLRLMLPSHIVAVPIFHPQKTFNELLK
jgi:hypothetical protein